MNLALKKTPCMKLPYCVANTVLYPNVDMMNY